jgi:hypothetical protein
LVLFTQNHFFDTSAFGGEQLFLDSTHGQYFTAQGDFSLWFG